MVFEAVIVIVRPSRSDVFAEPDAPAFPGGPAGPAGPCGPTAPIEAGSFPSRPTTGMVPGAPLSVDLRPFSFDAFPANLA
jgi:hypothetical protein